MNADQAKQKLETSINEAAQSLDNMAVDQAASIMLDLYRNQRADDCQLSDDGDMLLFQWGTYDWGEVSFLSLT